jgi:hypothetical protein
MFEKGQSGNPSGRPVGASSEQTKKMKAAFGYLIEGNLDRMTEWLDQIAEQDPKSAMDIIIRLSERFIPKLSQQQLVDGDGENLFKNIQFRFGEDHQPPQEKE